MQAAQAAMLRVSMQGRACTSQNSEIAHRALTTCACCPQGSDILRLPSTLCGPQLTTAPFHTSATASTSAKCL